MAGKSPEAPSPAKPAPSSPAAAKSPTKSPTKSPSPAKSGPTSPTAAKSPSTANPSRPAGDESPTRTPSPDPAGILPADHWAQAPVPEDDGESAMGESVNLSTSSITSSILNYRTIHGRRYHSDVGNAAYWASNDEQQSESMDVNHHTLTLGCGDKLYLAPLEEDKVQKVLDIGTGTGIWAIDFADQFPAAEVIGTDISPIQPGWVPPNLQFEIEDCTREWTFAPDSMDYIHIRWLFGSITDWYALFGEAYKTCSPGGWVESAEGGMKVESDHVEIPYNSAIAQWSRFFYEGGKKSGRTFTVVEEGLQRKCMEAAGFVDIQEFTFKRPLGTWPKDPIYKELGAMTQMTMEADAEGYLLYMASTLGWTRDEIQVYLAHYRREMRSNMYLPYYRQKVVWGRKPA